MNYETALKLKKSICIDCSTEIFRGNRSVRCAGCQLIYRKSCRLRWNRKYSSSNRRKVTEINVAYQNRKRATDLVWRENEKTRCHNRRVRLAGNGGFHSTDDWIALVESFDRKCVMCDERKPLTRDHIIPISRGGTNNIDNIQPLCGSCNSKKGAKIMYA